MKIIFLSIIIFIIIIILGFFLLANFLMLMITHPRKHQNLNHKETKDEKCKKKYGSDAFWFGNTCGTCPTGSYINIYMSRYPTFDTACSIGANTVSAIDLGPP